MKQGESAPHLSQGRWAERKALHYLRKQGMRHLLSNYRCRFGELDLIMEDGDCLVFVEVRYRRSTRFGGAIATIDAKKQARLKTTAEHYRQTRDWAARRPCRFDVIGIEDAKGETLHWIKNAF
ncbi:MAG: YraN family protein [Gammaproteobacteria bacterium]|nr:YraN family protein [Gammaproteobacteria bacterium]